MPRADLADGLAGSAGGGADRDDLVYGGGVEGLPVRGNRHGARGTADRIGLSGIFVLIGASHGQDWSRRQASNDGPIRCQISVARFISASGSRATMARIVSVELTRYGRTSARNSARNWQYSLFTGSGSRRKGVARAGVAAVLAAIAEAGGGVVEAYPEQVAGRDPQRGAYLHTGPESLFEEFGFVRDRRIAKWRWVMRLRISTEKCLVRFRDARPELGEVLESLFD